MAGFAREFARGNVVVLNAELAAASKGVKQLIDEGYLKVDEKYTVRKVDNRGCNGQIIQLREKGFDQFLSKFFILADGQSNG